MLVSNAIFDGLPRRLSGEESACSEGDMGSVPGLGRSPGEGNTAHSSILVWEIPWTEEPDDGVSKR